MIVNCEWCQKQIEKTSGHVNRARKLGMLLFCDRTCFGLHRRKNQTLEERKAHKSEYDRKYREKNREKRKLQNHEWFKRTYDPVKAKIERKKRLPAHLEYCRQPEYRAWKSEYDKKYLARKTYGEFADAYLTLTEVEKEIESRMTRFEVYAANGRRYAQWRKRQLSSQH